MKNKDYISRDEFKVFRNNIPMNNWMISTMMRLTDGKIPGFHLDK